MAEFRATHRYARISATKVRPFADLIRGKTAQEGLDALRYVPNRGARFLEKVLKSAMANAEHRSVRNVEHLIISEARVDGGPMYKRIRPTGTRNGVSGPAPLGPHPRRRRCPRLLRRDIQCGSVMGVTYYLT